MQKIIIITVLAFLSIAAQAQSKAQIKENNIKSTTVVEYDYSGGRESERKLSYERFNTRGQVIEFIDYDKTGKQKERIEYDYNDYNDCVEERFFNENNKLERVYKYTYNGELKQTKERYDARGKLIWKKVYMYEM